MSKDQYLRHVNLYGTEGVMATAAVTHRRGDISLEELVEIQAYVDEQTKPKPRGTATDRVNKLLGIEVPA